MKILIEVRYHLNGYEQAATSTKINEYHNCQQGNIILDNLSILELVIRSSSHGKDVEVSAFSECFLFKNIVFFYQVDIKDILVRPLKSHLHISFFNYSPCINTYYMCIAEVPEEIYSMVDWRVCITFTLFEFLLRNENHWRIHTFTTFCLCVCVLLSVTVSVCEQNLLSRWTAFDLVFTWVKDKLIKDMVQYNKWHLMTYA